MATFNMNVTGIDEHDRCLIEGLFESLDNGLLFIDMMKAMVDKTIEERESKDIDSDTFAKAVMLALLAYSCSCSDNQADVETISGFTVEI